MEPHEVLETYWQDTDFPLEQGAQTPVGKITM